MSKSLKNLLVIGIFIVSMALVILLLVLTQPKDKDDTEEVIDTTVALVSYERDNIDNFRVKTADGEYTIKQTPTAFAVVELEGLAQNSTVPEGWHCLYRILWN